jgi:hypothetical protein|tara:strand:- start:267 stop:1046 length:780 start_codon:yes stop_codon:yes gene_type:complete
MSDISKRIHESLLINTFFSIRMQAEVYWPEYDKNILTNIDPIKLDANNWDKHKREFFRQRFNFSQFEIKEEFILHEKKIVRTFKTDGLPPGTTTRSIVRFELLCHKYLAFLENEAIKENVDFGYNTLKLTNRATSVELKERFTTLYTILSDKDVIRTNREIFQRAFSGRVTREPLNIKIKVSQIVLFNIIEWLYTNSIIETKDRWAVIRKSQIFEYWHASNWKPVNDIKQYKNKPVSSKFQPFKEILHKTFLGISKKRE